MFFKESRPDRAKKAGIKPALSAAHIPPAKPYELLTEFDIRSGNCGQDGFVFDVESYTNYFCVGFKCARTGKVICFEDSPNSVIDCSLLGYILFRFLVIGFNSKVYDLPILGHALAGVRCNRLKEISNELILSDQPSFNLQLASCNHIDLIDIAPITASLKIYAGRLHCERMQDLPYSESASLTPLEAQNVRDYNLNDLSNTLLLYQHLRPQIELRIALSTEYGIDLRSKSDAQVAEAVIVSELGKLEIRTGKPTIEPGKSFRLQMPPGLRFSSERLNKVLETVLETDFVIQDNGAVETPKRLTDLDIRIGDCSYTMGIGGLHSNEKSVSDFSTNIADIIDRDVASYYPRILLNQAIEPPQLQGFIKVFASIVERRLKAKKLGDEVTAGCLKIVINGIIGKLSNQYSKVYFPEGNTQITVSGQLYLLMLIEMIEIAGFQVLSANTDGVVTMVPKTRKVEFDAIVQTWEKATNFETEETVYSSIHCRDVNNYIAVKSDGSTKVKGIYAEKGSAAPGELSKNPESLIISDALQAFLAKGVKVETTVNTCRDIRRFVNVRNVKGGAYKNNTYLGKAVRWYYSSEERDVIRYVLSNNAVPKSDNARPCMDLPKCIPSDLDFDYYIKEANEALYDVGYLKRGQVDLL